MTNQPQPQPQSNNGLFYVIAGLFGSLLLVAAYWIFVRKKDDETAPANIAGSMNTQNNQNCITVDPNLPIWTDPGWLDDVGINYMKTLVNNRYGEFGLKNADEATQTGIGFFKAIGLKPTKTAVTKYKNELIAYMKSDDKAFHWAEAVGRKKCS